MGREVFALDGWIVWGAAVFACGIMYFLQRRGVKFGIRVLVGMVFGLIVGIVLQDKAQPLGLIGSVYVNLIRMLVMPLVFSAVISSFTSVSDPKQLGKLGLKTVALFLVTTAVAAAVGLGVGLLFDPGAGITFSANESFSAREIPPFSQVVLDLVPNNPVSEMASGKVVPVIFFGIFIAAAITLEGVKRPEAVKPFRDFIHSFNQVMFGVAKIAIRATPYGVFGLIAVMAARYGLSTLLPLGKVIAALYVACLLHMAIVYGGLVGLVARVNPVTFFRKAMPTIAIAFSTRSSYATLPVNLEVITKRMKVSQRVASFVAPLGATMNFDGCGGIWPAIVAIFVAKVFGVPLGVTEYFILIGAAALGSIGVAGVPGPASIATTVVLTSLGLPLEGMGLLLGIDALVDMGRTAVNATGTTVSALLIGVSEGEFDREAFQSEKDDPLELDGAAVA